MAHIHILDGSRGIYTAVVHTAMPSGTNTAGVTWVAAMANSGSNTSSMTVGNGAGQISQAELNQLQAGTLFESVIQFQNDPAWTATERNNNLEIQAAAASTEQLQRLQDRLAMYGYIRT